MSYDKCPKCGVGELTHAYDISLEQSYTVCLNCKETFWSGVELDLTRQLAAKDKQIADLTRELAPLRRLEARLKDDGLAGRLAAENCMDPK